MGLGHWVNESGQRVNNPFNFLYFYFFFFFLSGLLFFLIFDFSSFLLLFLFLSSSYSARAFLLSRAFLLFFPFFPFSLLLLLVQSLSLFIFFYLLVLLFSFCPLSSHLSPLLNREALEQRRTAVRGYGWPDLCRDLGRRRSSGHGWASGMVTAWIELMMPTAVALEQRRRDFRWWDGPRLHGESWRCGGGRRPRWSG